MCVIFHSRLGVAEKKESKKGHKNTFHVRMKAKRERKFNFSAKIQQIDVKLFICCRLSSPLLDHKQRKFFFSFFFPSQLAWLNIHNFWNNKLSITESENSPSSKDDFARFTSLAQKKSFNFWVTKRRGNFDCFHPRTTFAGLFFRLFILVSKLTAVSSRPGPRNGNCFAVLNDAWRVERAWRQKRSGNWMKLARLKHLRSTVSDCLEFPRY